MSSGEIITSSLVHIMQQPHKYEIDLIHENTDEEGHIKCIKCESDYLKEEEREIPVSVGFNKPSKYKLQSYFCDNCDYFHIDDDDTKDIRKYLSK